MATKKQKRTEALAKREAFMAEERVRCAKILWEARQKELEILESRQRQGDDMRRQEFLRRELRNSPKSHRKKSETVSLAA